MLAFPRNQVQNSAQASCRRLVRNAVLRGKVMKLTCQATPARDRARRSGLVLFWLISLTLVAFLGFTTAARAQPTSDAATLSQTIAKLDAEVFDAYNRCDLTAFGKFFDPNVEFYHDTGGATFDRRTVVENTRKYICNKVRRELIASSLIVYPIKDFGAIAEGEHRFCPIVGGACEGVAKFLIVWHKEGSGWRITRVISYGHRALGDNG